MGSEDASLLCHGTDYEKYRGSGAVRERGVRIFPSPPPPNRYTFCALLRAGPSSPIETTPLLLLGTHVVNLKCALLLQR